MKFLKTIVTAASLTALATPAIAQRLPPDQLIRRSLNDANAAMTDALPSIVTHGQIGQTDEISGWRVIKTGKTTSAGLNSSNGLVAFFDADPNHDGSPKDERFSIFQSTEYICPDDIKNDPRMAQAGMKPSIDVVATAVIRNKRLEIYPLEQQEVVNFVPGSVLDKLFCSAD